VTAQQPPGAAAQQPSEGGPLMVDVFSDTAFSDTAFSDTAFSDTALANPAGYAVTALAAADPRILTLTADLSNVLAEFRERFADRYIELGIAETNSVSLAAGLATCGYVPYIYSMAPFGVIKCAEQLRTDVAYNHLPVRLVGRLSGLAMGFFGTSHHAIEDIAIARTLPNLTVVAPADGRAVLSLMRATAGLPGPVYVRISENTPEVYDPDVYGTVPHFEPGRWPRLRSGTDVTLIGHGLGAGLAVRAADELAAGGLTADVYDAAYLKPFDEDAIVDTARRTGRVVTVEDHTVTGGLASIVAETVARHKLAVGLAAVALPDEDLEVGVPAELYEHYGLTVSGVAGAARALVSSR
jgi:transketolase